jgi:hypothetical protein
MAHKRKDTISQKPVEWAKHLRPFGKRQVSKSERRAARRMMAFEERDVVCHNFAFGARA